MIGFLYRAEAAFKGQSSYVQRHSSRVPTIAVQLVPSSLSLSLSLSLIHSPMLMDIAVRAKHMDTPSIPIITVRIVPSL